MVCPTNQQCSVHKNTNGAFEARCITPTTVKLTSQKVVTPLTTKSTAGKVVTTTKAIPKSIKDVITTTKKSTGGKSATTPKQQTNVKKFAWTRHELSLSEQTID